MDSLSRTHKVSRLVIIALLIAGTVLIVLLVSIAISWEHIYNVRKNTKTPYDYPGSVWKSENPAIELEVSDNMRNIKDSECRIYVDGKPIKVVFNPGLYPQNATFLCVRDSNVLIRCKAKFSKTEVILTVLEDNIYGGEYRKIVLKLQE